MKIYKGLCTFQFKVSPYSQSSAVIKKLSKATFDRSFGWGRSRRNFGKIYSRNLTFHRFVQNFRNFLLLFRKAQGFRF